MTVYTLNGSADEHFIVYLCLCRVILFLTVVDIDYSHGLILKRDLVKVC